MPRTRRQLKKQIEDMQLLWEFARSVFAFIGGMAIMFWETIVEKADRPWLYAAAVGMMGLPVARAAERALNKLTGSGTEEE